MRHKYTTTREHAGHPAGTECEAERLPSGELLLVFGDGPPSEVVLPRHFYLVGIEQPIGGYEFALAY